MPRIEVKVEAQGKTGDPQRHHRVEIMVPLNLPHALDQPGVGDHGDEERDAPHGQDQAEGFRRESAHVDEVAALDKADGRAEAPEEDKQDQQPDGAALLPEATEARRPLRHAGKPPTQRRPHRLEATIFVG